MEQLVVRSVMEENPKFVEEIFVTQEKLRSRGFLPEDALKEAKILHGILP